MKIRLTINHEHIARVLQARREKCVGETIRVTERSAK